MTEPSVSFAGNLTDDPELRHTEGGIARAMFRMAVSGRREQEASFFTVVVWRNQAEHAAESLSKGSRVVVVGRLQQRAWTAEDGSARSTVEVVADELGPSLRWSTATTTRTTRSSSQLDQSGGRDVQHGVPLVGLGTCDHAPPLCSVRLRETSSVLSRTERSTSSVSTGSPRPRELSVSQPGAASREPTRMS
jgi:single-strand DNA-binding protein